MYDESNNVTNPYLQIMSQGPLNEILSYQTYYVNGYKFQSKDHNQNKSTYNCGICVKGSNDVDDMNDYYGVLEEIIELQYFSGLSLVVFKCEWFDPTSGKGTVVNRMFPLVEINQRGRYDKYDPFCLAVQSSQVCYLSYPCASGRRRDWLAVCKIKARGELQVSDRIYPESMAPPLQEEEDEIEEEEAI